MMPKGLGNARFEYFWDSPPCWKHCGGRHASFDIHVLSTEQYVYLKA
jgi:hypothetical protein